MLQRMLQHGLLASTVCPYSLLRTWDSLQTTMKISLRLALTKLAVGAFSAGSYSTPKVPIPMPPASSEKINEVIV